MELCQERSVSTAPKLRSIVMQTHLVALILRLTSDVLFKLTASGPACGVKAHVKSSSKAPTCERNSPRIAAP